MYDFNKKNYACPEQTLTLRTPPKEIQMKFGFSDLKEPAPGPEQKGMEDMAAQHIATPQAENLPAIPHTALTKFDMQATVLAEIKKYQSLVVDILDKKTFNVAKKAKSKVRNLRLEIQRREKELNSDLIKKKAELKKDASFIVTDIKETEDYLSAEIKKWDNEQARLKKIEEEKEAASLKIVEENLNLLTETCNKGLKPNLSAAEIKAAGVILNQTIIPQEVFQEKYQDACNLLSFSIENTQRAYNEAVIYEKKQAEMVQIEEASQRVDQVAWFNDNFGVMADLPTMEAGFKKLEDMAPADHLAELITGQIEKARAIIEKTRAIMPEVTEETPAIDTTTPTKPQVEGQALVQFVRRIDRQTTTQEEKAQPPENSEHVSNAQLVENFKDIDFIINTAAPGSLELILSNGQAAVPIMLSIENLHSILAIIKTKFEQAVKAKS